MDPAPKTVRQLAEELFALMPHGISTDTLHDYGIDATGEQARQITLEVLYLNRFWIQSALEALLTPTERERVLEAMDRLLVSGWGSALGLRQEDHQAHATQWPNRRTAYSRIVEEGGSPVAVYTQAAVFLEMSQVIEPEDRMKLVALLVDMVPVEAFGDLLQDIEVADV